MDELIIQFVWWILGAFVAVITSLLAIVSWWFKDRVSYVNKKFESMNDRMVKQSEVLLKQNEKLHRHDIEITGVLTHMEYAKQQRDDIETHIKGIDTKLDDLIEVSRNSQMVARSK